MAAPKGLATTLTNTHKLISFAINSLIAIALMTFLLFLDEGACNFEWTKSKDALLFFSAFVFSILIGQFLAAKFLLKNYFGKGKIFFVNLVGIPLGIGSMWLLMSIVGTIYHFI
jgi:hypothetical protein